MQEKIKNNEYGVLTFSSVMVVLAIPAIIHGLGYAWQNFLGGIGSIDGWLSYWGGYLGGVVGMVGVVLTTLFIISIQNKHHKDQLINQNSLHRELLENQNNQHQEQLKQQRDDIVMSINSTVQLEREKFMLQFNIEKYERSLMLLLKLNKKVDSHFQKYEDAVRFIAEYITYDKESTKVISDKEYKKYLDLIFEVENEIREILQELLTVEKTLNSFDVDEIDEVICQYLLEVYNNAILLNSADKKEYFEAKRLYDLLDKSRKILNNCKVTVNSRIKEELLKFRPMKEKMKAE